MCRKSVMKLKYTTKQNHCDAIEGLQIHTSALASARDHSALMSKPSRRDPMRPSRILIHLFHGLEMYSILLELHKPLLTSIAPDVLGGWVLIC